MPKSKWVIVSNRLPLTVKNGKVVKGSGGLVTAISGIETKSEIMWMGAAPSDIPPAQFNKQLNSFKDKIKYKAVFVSEEDYADYYNNICNDCLWPLLHYETQYVKFDFSSWETYRKINEEFAIQISKNVKDTDLVWIHDFHLFLVAGFLKKLRPKLKIGFFLHIPFPSSEIFRQLPVAEEIIEGLTSYDLVGFHDYSYLRHFISSCKVLKGYDADSLSVHVGQHHLKVGVFPASINTESFKKLAKSAKTKKLIKKSNRLQILGVDRLDYIKGIDLKLIAFEKLLETYPEHIASVQLLQLAVPTRTDVPEYQHLKEEVEKLVGRINGRFGTPSYVPVKYMYNTVTPHELSAMYQTSDVLLITSKRDGMNLVALEYIVSQDLKDPGVLVLSEFTGAMSNLDSSLRINPWNKYETAEVLHHALIMDKEERVSRMKSMDHFLSGYSATTWAESFIKELNSYTEGKNMTKDITKDLKLPIFDKRYTKRDKFIFLDYDGTLTPIVNNPQDAILSSKMKNLVKKLNKKKNVSVCVVSGREKRFLQAQFDDKSLAMATEHGAQYFDPNLAKWRSLISDPSKKWMKSAVKIMEDFAKKVPQSFVEKKEYSLSWHYRNSPEEYANFQARKLKIELEDFLQTAPVAITSGKKIVEVKDISANKGSFVRWFLERYENEEAQILAIGDDVTDEDMFAELDEEQAFTVKVGNEETNARYRVKDQELVYQLLEKIDQKL